MEIITLSILFGTIVIADEVLNGQYQLSQRLLDWFDNTLNSSKESEN
ncbi:MAG: hypothetical protein SWJ54_16565 [Cyanobacteriota bacterium]|nr:hypothetical protein [Cyanobacteriota bacterium]